MDPYVLSVSAASAGEFHARAVPDPAVREIWWHQVDRPALVLGSTQSRDVADQEACRRAGVDIVQRRSGGGAVLLVPGSVTWVDVIVPREAPGWATDIHTPMVWLGRRLAASLADVAPGVRFSVHDGPLRATSWSADVCFDGLGAGEVLADGVKLVGMSQRRTRHAARLQCCWYSSYDPDELRSLLAPEHRPPAGALGPVATLGADVSDAAVAQLGEHLDAD